MKPLMQISQNPKNKRSWNKPELGSAIEEELIQLVINYYMDYWQEITKAFFSKSYNDTKDLLHFALEYFIQKTHVGGKWKLSPSKRQYLQQVLEQIRIHYLDMWEEFLQDEEYQKLLNQSDFVIKQMLNMSNKCPLTRWDLRICLGACEAFMSVVD